MRKMLLTMLPAAIIAAPAAAQTGQGDGDTDWTVSLSGGTTTIAGDSDQPFASIGLTRHWGETYLRLSGTYVDSGGDAAALTTVPASTRQLTLGAGTLAGALAIDGYVSLGDRNFDARAYTTRTGRTIMVDSGGSSLGAGLSLTYEVPIGDSGVFAPFVAGDYSRISIARALLLPGGTSLAEESSEKGVTGSAGFTALWLLGSEQRHSIGLYGAALASSNNSSYNGTNAQRATALGIGDQPGVSDEWLEYGAIASIGMSDTASLNLGIVRTAGFLGPEATSFSGGLSFSF